MKTVLIVGTSFHTLREYLTNQGYDYITLRDITKTKSPEKKLKRRVVCDFSSKESILKAVDIAQSKTKIDAVLTTYENYILPAAHIAEYLGLPGIPVASAQACTDKYLMRQLFAKAPNKISPAFAHVTTKSDVTSFAAKYGYPLILKPANLAKSLLVTKNHDEKELLANYEKMQQSINGVYRKYAPHRQPKIIIEEFMEGPIHSVDAFVDEVGVPHVMEQVVDYQSGYEIGYDDNFHYSRIIPTRLNPEQVQAIRHTAAIGCRALGMKSSPAHVEIIRTKNGPRIVEIGARNGGYRERMHGIANGIDITGNALRLALGQSPQLKASLNGSCAVLELFPKQAGVFLGIQNEESLQRLASLNYYSVKATKGSSVGKASDGYKMCAVIMLASSDPEQFKQDREYVNASVSVMTQS